jgi:hypothetical protein
MKKKRVFHSAKICFFISVVTMICFIGSPIAYAQIEMVQTGSHFQDFNSLSATGSANTWVDNQTIPGWYWGTSVPAEPLTYFSDNGTSDYLGKRCYGTTGSSDRAIGGRNKFSTGIKYSYGVKLHNSSNKTITNISVAYIGEQWKVGTDDNEQPMKFYFKVTSDPAATFTSDITLGWTNVLALEFGSPQTTKSTLLRVLDGNNPSNRVVVNEYSIPFTTPVNPGDYVLLRWFDKQESQEHGMAIDDVTIKWTVPVDNTTPNIWTGSQSSDWFDNRNWSKAFVPNNETDVEIANTPNKAVANENISIKSLKTANGGQLTVNPGKTITVTEASIFNGHEGLILKSPTTFLPNSPNDHSAAASFLSNGTVSGQGSVKVERYVTGFQTETDGWHFFSSPVDHPLIEGLFLPASCDALYEYYEATDAWLDQKEVLNDIRYFVNGSGYLIAFKNNVTPSVTGIPNNSNIKVNNMTFNDDRGWHLLGNPYPCGISWGGTEWAINHIGFVAKLLNSGGTYSDLSVGDTIPAMNGFFVKVNDSINTITIPKAARIHSISSGWKQTKAAIGKKLKLIIKSATDNTFAETRIILDNLATTEYDLNYDSPYLSGMPDTPLFYSVLSNGRELSTNTLPEATSLIFNLEFTPGLARAYTFKAEISDDWIRTASFVLEDKLTNLKHTLTNGASFTFNSDAIDSPGRFRLIVDVVTGLMNNNTDANLKISSLNRQVTITFPDNINKGQVTVYELSGKRVYSSEIRNPALKFNLVHSGIYMVHLLINNQYLTRKIIVP